MPRTLVIQSHTDPLPYPWLDQCLASVRRWAESRTYGYRFMNDELFDAVPADLKQKTAQRRVVASDLARLQVLRQALDAGYDRVVWLDADFLIFQPDDFDLPDTPYAVGREVWVQDDGRRRLKVHRKVHNALLMFRRGNSFLDFYAETAERLLRENDGGMPAQFIGPKLLTALHNVCRLPVMETAGMLSPTVIRDLLSGGGDALQRFLARSPRAIAGANLCLSSRDSGAVSDDQMVRVIARLRDEGLPSSAGGSSQR